MSDPEPLPDERLTEKDMSYSPSSGRETEERQKSPARSRATDDVDESEVQVLPGTGGPDDTGAVSPDPDELHMPRDKGPH